MVTVKYSPGSGNEVYITSEEARQFERVLDEAGFYTGTVEVRGAGSEAKVEGKEAHIRVLQEYFPDLVCGAEYQKSNGKLSVRLSENSRAADKVTSTMKKVGETQRKEKSVNEELIGKIDDFFKIN